MYLKTIDFSKFSSIKTFFVRFEIVNIEVKIESF